VIGQAMKRKTEKGLCLIPRVYLPDGTGWYKRRSCVPE
jgi:hypothetical protein